MRAEGGGRRPFGNGALRRMFSCQFAFQVAFSFLIPGRRPRPAALHRVGRSPARRCAGTFFEFPAHPSSSSLGEHGPSPLRHHRHRRAEAQPRGRAPPCAALARAGGGQGQRVRARPRARRPLRCRTATVSRCSILKPQCGCARPGSGSASCCSKAFSSRASCRLLVGAPARHGGAQHGPGGGARRASRRREARRAAQGEYRHEPARACSVANMPRALERLQRNTRVGGITLMTHFANADDARGVAWQMERLRRLPGYGALPRSLANSAAILRYPETALRLGAARHHALRLLALSRKAPAARPD